MDCKLAWYDEEEKFNALSGPIYGMRLPTGGKVTEESSSGPIKYYFVFNNRQIGGFKTREDASATLRSVSAGIFYQGDKAAAR